MALKKLYETLDLEVVCFAESDVIRTSNDSSSSDNNDGEWEID